MEKSENRRTPKNRRTSKNRRTPQNRRTPAPISSGIHPQIGSAFARCGCEWSSNSCDGRQPIGRIGVPRGSASSDFPRSEKLCFWKSLVEKGDKKVLTLWNRGPKKPQVGKTKTICMQCRRATLEGPTMNVLMEFGNHRNESSTLHFLVRTRASFLGLRHCGAVCLSFDGFVQSFLCIPM